MVVEVMLVVVELRGGVLVVVVITFMVLVAIKVRWLW